MMLPVVPGKDGISLPKTPQKNRAPRLDVKIHVDYVSWMDRLVSLSRLRRPAR